MTAHGGRERAWRQVVALCAAAVLLVSAGSVLLAVLAANMILDMLAEEFLFILGLVLAVPLLPASAIPVVFSAWLWLQVVQMVRQGPGGRAGPRLVAQLIAIGLTGLMAGVALRDSGPWVPVLLGGLFVTSCAGGSLWLASRSRAEDRLAESFVPTRPAAPPGEAADASPWTYHVDLSRRRES